MKYAPQWLIKNADFKIGKSLFKLPGENDTISTGNKVEVVTETEKVFDPNDVYGDAPNPTQL